MLYFRDKGDTEISGFGIAEDPEDLLRITDFVTVKQKASTATFEMEDEAVGDFALDMVEKGLKPEQFMRVWLHTHPGNFCTPSGTDEECFNRWFGGCDWGIMCILAKDDKMYARLRFNTGPRADIEIPVTVDYSIPFPASNQEAWAEEHTANIEKEYYTVTSYGSGSRSGGYNWKSGYNADKYKNAGQNARHFNDAYRWPYGPYDDDYDDIGYSNPKQESIGFKAEETEETKTEKELPEVVWPLRHELNSCMGEEERKILLQDLQLDESQVDDYYVYYDDIDVVAVSKEEVEKSVGTFIYDEVEKTKATA